MYQPNFCCDCGTRILRERWHLWTSRCFCDDCLPRLRRTQIIKPAFFSLLALALGWSIGQLRPSPTPVVIEQRAISPVITNNPTALPDKPIAAPQNPALLNTAIVSICGARTKKGAPCSRRVTGTGRCYQHLGLAAMLPPEQLIVRR